MLQCAYHRWEFQADGSLQRVPQQGTCTTSTSTSTASSANCGRVQNYPVQRGGGMIWVWPDATTGQKAVTTPLPVSHLLTEYLKDYPGAGFMRDLPYGYELLAENLLDISHLPFSHHGTGGFNRNLWLSNSCRKRNETIRHLPKPTILPFTTIKLSCQRRFSKRPLRTPVSPIQR